MRHPDWWQFVLLILAAWRVYRLLAVDDVSERPRGWVTLPDWLYGVWAGHIEALRAQGADAWQDDLVPPFSKRRYYWSRFARCPWCAGWWLSLAAWACWLAWPAATLAVAAPFAVSAGVGIIQQHVED